MKRKTFMVLWIVWVLSIALALGSWLTHVLVCLSAGKWVLLVVGALVVPIAIVHGTGYWFGLF